MLWRSTAHSRRPVGFVEPCIPTLGHAVPSGPQWAHEIKHDGFRLHLPPRRRPRARVLPARARMDRVRAVDRRGAGQSCGSGQSPSMARAWCAARTASRTSTDCAPPSAAWARGMRSSTPSICWRSTATICATFRRETLTSLLRKARDGIRQLRLDVLKDIEADPMSTATDVRRRLQSHAPLSTARCRPCIFLSC